MFIFPQILPKMSNYPRKTRRLFNRVSNEYSIRVLNLNNCRTVNSSKVFIDKFYHDTSYCIWPRFQVEFMTYSCLDCHFTTT